MSMNFTTANNLFDQTGIELYAGDFLLKFHAPEIRKIFKHPLEKELIESHPFQRLKEIRFLGAQDYIFHPNSAPSSKRQTRYDHSLGVGRLAKIYSKEKKLNPNEENLLVTVALLHDIGHPPLSHSFEPVLKSNLGKGHHQLTENIIRGNSIKFGKTIPQILSKFDLKPEEILNLINGQDQSEFAFLFKSPINIDTIEGICRANSYRKANQNFINPDKIISHLIKFNSAGQKTFDSFWLLKKEIYKFHVQNPINLLSDFIATFYFQKYINRVSPTRLLYLLEETETELKKSLPRLFDYLWIIPRIIEGKENFDNLEKQFEKSILREIREIISTPISYTQRNFFIDEKHQIKKKEDLNKRYQQKKVSKILKPFEFNPEQQRSFSCLLKS